MAAAKRVARRLAEDQARADERIPELLATPAAKRFLSAKPLLGPIDLTMLIRLTPTHTIPKHGSNQYPRHL